ncbi:MAG: DUF5107 domain-containing protein [Bryobacterales bacterium]|nr:DUF5107 domain-containing protein [Bryobacterales bacterium]
MSARHPCVFTSCLLLSALTVLAAESSAVKTYEATLEIPTYEHSARELEPPLFGNSSVRGLYPFTTYRMPFKPGGPKPRKYRSIHLENEYLKLTYLPELGGRIFSVYDKVRGREMFYRNDVIKPVGYNPRNSWHQSGIELTGPYDAHMLTLYGEPFWSNKVISNADGSMTLMLGELDPVYHMRVDLSATLYPGIAAVKMSVFCYNTRDGRMPQMFWLSAALPGTEKTQFIYPMTRTIGHTTSEIADWPVHNGVDYSWDRNNRNMLGVFGIDIYDNFQGAYHHDHDYGVFRYADRRVVQGMKMWTFGYGPNAKSYEMGYTDTAGPYVEVQSGRHVWDGHYEWVYPHKTESWSEWWVPVSGIGGLTTLSRDVALNLKADAGAPARLALTATRPLPGARIMVKADAGVILDATADLAPGKPYVKDLGLPASGATGLVVTVTEAGGGEILRYARPDTNPGRKEYTPFTRSLEKPQKTPEQMTVEELVLAARFKLKELNSAAGLDLLNKALERDSGFSRAHLEYGIYHFNHYRYREAVKHLEQVIERDPYADEAYYYLSISQLRLGETAKAERNLYYIWPGSAHYSNREYNLARIALGKSDLDEAVAHLRKAIEVDGRHLSARALLAAVSREREDRAGAVEQIEAIERMDPGNRIAQAERWLLTGDERAGAELVRLMGGQSQEAIGTSSFYRDAGRWTAAAKILKLVETNNADRWGTPPEFYYILAYCLHQSGSRLEASHYLVKARSAAGNVDRFPYRENSKPALEWAIAQDPRDALALYLQGTLDYYLGRSGEGIRSWENAVRAKSDDFRSRRALGLAYAEQGRPVETAAVQLEKAVALNPDHVATLNDLSALYAKAGRFDEQLAVLQRALKRSPGDDNLAEGVLTANLIKGHYDAAEQLVASHRFTPRHRSYGLRDKYRLLRYGLGGAAFRQGRYPEAIKQFEAALEPPVSLGVDDFASQTSPQKEYYLGRTLDAQGDKDAACRAYERAITGIGYLSGDSGNWNGENFHMVLALDRLGRAAEASKLAEQFENYARTQLDSRRPARRVESRYVLGLSAEYKGHSHEARKMFEEAVALQPDFLPARMHLRGDLINSSSK